MILQPRKTRYKKAQKGRINPYLMRKRNGINMLDKKYSYLISSERGRLSSVQIEAARIALNRKFRKYGKLQITVFPNVPVTKKPNEVRMGQGKGPVVRWIIRIKPKRVIFKIPYLINRSKIGFNALNAAAHKLPFKTHIIHTF